MVCGVRSGGEDWKRGGLTVDSARYVRFAACISASGMLLVGASRMLSQFLSASIILMSYPPGVLWTRMFWHPLSAMRQDPMSWMAATRADLRAFFSAGFFRGGRCLSCVPSCFSMRSVLRDFEDAEVYAMSSGKDFAQLGSRRFSFSSWKVEEGE